MEVAGQDFYGFRGRRVSDGFFDAEETGFAAGVFDLSAGEAGGGGGEVVGKVDGEAGGRDNSADAHG